MLYKEKRKIESRVLPSTKRTGENQVGILPEVLPPPRTGDMHSSHEPIALLSSQQLRVKRVKGLLSLAPTYPSTTVTSDESDQKFGLLINKHRKLNSSRVIDLYLDTAEVDVIDLQELYRASEELLAMLETLKRNPFVYLKSSADLEENNESVSALAEDAEVMVEESEILALIEKQPLTIKNISETIDIPLELARSNVKLLFNKGFIDELDSSTVQKIFPFIRRKRFTSSKISDSLTHFTLTVKGYFKLHPFLTFVK